jgi:hypothetical protein
MATKQELQDFLNAMADAREEFVRQRAADFATNPGLVDEIDRVIQEQVDRFTEREEAEPVPPDAGFAQLFGIGDETARELGQTRQPLRVLPYDETVTPERLRALADLYYFYQHEKIGVFRVVKKLQEMFRAGTIRISEGEGALRLYQFDKRDVLRFTRRDRMAAYKRVFGYGSASPPEGAQPNTEFHSLLRHFVHEVTLFWRDKRISEVIRERPNDPAFGSIATVRRAGLDLRNNLKWASYGHVNVMSVELMQLLDEAFRIFGAPDILRQFGADTPWDVIEDLLTRFLGEQLETSARHRMADAGRQILRWIAEGAILHVSRAQFEALLAEIADDAEEWITSAHTLGVAERRPPEARFMMWARRGERANRTA